MALRDTEPDPTNPHDPRVLVQWTDDYGNVIKPGDLVAYSDWRGIKVGRLYCVHQRRKDGKKFSGTDVKFEIDLLDEKLVPLTWKRTGEWLPAAGRRIDYQVPIILQQKITFRHRSGRTTQNIIKYTPAP